MVLAPCPQAPVLSPVGIPVTPAWAAQPCPALHTTMLTSYSQFGSFLLTYFQVYQVFPWLFISAVLFLFLTFPPYSYSFYLLTDIPSSAPAYYPPFPPKCMNHCYIKFLLLPVSGSSLNLALDLVSFTVSFFLFVCVCMCVRF